MLFKTISFLTIFISLSILSMSIANAQQAMYDFSETPDLQLFIVTFSSQPGVTSGIFLHKAPDKKVKVANGWVNTVGAGIFMGSEKYRIRDGRCWFAKDKKGKGGKSYLERLPIEVTIESYWHKSEVVEDITVRKHDGNEFSIGLAKPMKGAIERLKMKSNAMEQPLYLAVESNGLIEDGALTIELLGRSQVHFVSNLTRVLCYITLDNSGLKSLRSALPKQDQNIVPR